jgi:sugar phosphate isomerase/epimerase
MLNVGLVTRSLGGLSAAQCAETMARLGFFQTELCLTFADKNVWSYNGVTDLSGVDDGFALRTVDEFRRRGIEVVSWGAFTNPAEPDPEKFRAVEACWTRFCELAEITGVRYVATETGFQPGRRGICADTYEADFLRFADQMRTLCRIAAAHSVEVAFEPCMLDLTPSAKRTADFAGLVGEPNLKILLDPANLIHNSGEEEMFASLAPRLAYVHGKDRKLTDTYGRNLGEGEIDWTAFFRAYEKYAPGAPFLLEYVNADNCCEVRDRALRFYRNAVEER